SEDVVDEEQHVRALVAEILGDREARQPDAQARPGRLVHLSEDESRVLEDAGLGHLEVEVIALAGPLADACEDRVALVLARDVADQLLDQPRLAEAGAAEQSDLAALDEGRDQVDDLEARLEDLGSGLERVQAGWVSVDRPALVGLDGLVRVDRLAEHVEDPAKRRL